MGGLLEPSQATSRLNRWEWASPTADSGQSANAEAPRSPRVREVSAGRIGHNRPGERSTEVDSLIRVSPGGPAVNDAGSGRPRCEIVYAGTFP